MLPAYCRCMRSISRIEIQRTQKNGTSPSTRKKILTSQVQLMHEIKIRMSQPRSWKGLWKNWFDKQQESFPAKLTTATVSQWGFTGAICHFTSGISVQSARDVGDLNWFAVVRQDIEMYLNCLDWLSDEFESWIILSGFAVVKMIRLLSAKLESPRGTGM